MQPLEKIPAGKPITAGWLARLVESVNFLLARADAGDGGGGGGGSTAKVMAAMGGAIGGSRDRFVPVKLKDLRLDTSVGPVGQRDPINGSYWPSQVKYHFVGIGIKEIDVDNAVPYFGRPVKGDEARIYPASIGSTALLERNVGENGEIEPRLYLLPGWPGGEVVARRRCG